VNRSWPWCAPGRAGVHRRRIPHPVRGGHGQDACPTVEHTGRYWVSEDENLAVAIERDLAARRPVTWEQFKAQLSPETVTFGVGMALFAKAYLETLGRRVAEGTADLPKYMRQLAQKRVRRRDMPDLTYIGMKDGTAATIVVDDYLPDEARLALLDLDVTDPQLRGRELYLDCVAQARRPWPLEPDDATHDSD
jgi:hypothetical protein